MKRMERRSIAVLALALALAIGLGFFLLRLARSGGDWAAYTANEHVYQLGRLQCGTLTDRNETMLLRAEDGVYTYAPEENVRRASLHAVGDEAGYMGGTALSLFGQELVGWSFWNGTDGRGGTVALSLDSRLQAAAWDALNGRSGAVVLMDYTTGEILSMVSAPAYDPAAGAELDREGVLVNRCTGAAMAPGSVFKLVTLIAAYENLPDLQSRRFVCEGSAMVGGEELACVKKHGSQTVETALCNSCNVAFGELAVELGGECLRATAERLGLLEALEIDGYRTAPGTFDVAPRGSSLEAWSGIGQYHDLVTPYAMARLCAAIANGGAAREGSLRLGARTPTAELMPPATAEYLDQCMNYTGYYGYRALFPGLDMGAKSGTAELGDGTDHAWMVGYLRSGPPLAFAVAVEHGGWGLYDAGPVANAVLQKAVEIYAND